MHHMWQPWRGSSEQREYRSKRFSSDLDRLEPLYKFSALLYFYFYFANKVMVTSYAGPLNELLQIVGKDI